MERLRRLRKSPLLRDAVAETQIKIRGLIYPIFVQWGTGIKEEVSSMPGVYRYSVDRLPELLDAVLQAGIGGVMVFGIPQHKDETGSDCQSLDGIAPTAIGLSKITAAKRGRNCWWWRTSACVSTPATATAACWSMGMWKMTLPFLSTPRRP